MWRRTAIGLVVAVPVLAFVFLRADVGETIDALQDANYALMPLAAVLFIAGSSFQALRWRFLLKALVDVSPLRLYPLVFIGHLGNSILPLRGGDLLRAFVLNRREGVSVASALGTLVVEHILDGMMLVGLLIIFVASSNTGERLRQVALVSGLVFGAIGCALVAAAIWRERTERLAEIVVSRLPEHWQERIQGSISSFLAGTRALRSLEVVAVALITTVAYWLTVSVVYLIVGEAFHLDEGVDAYLLVTAAANLAFSVPLTQGGVGSFEFLVQQALIFADVSEAVAAAYALALHALILLSLLAAGLVSLWLVGLSLREIGEDVASAGDQLEEEQSLGVE